MFKLLKKFTKTEWMLSLAAFAFIILQVWLELTMPDCFIINRIIYNKAARKTFPVPNSHHCRSFRAVNYLSLLQIFSCIYFILLFVIRAFFFHKS